MKENNDCHMEHRFNLIEEPWIPVVDVGLVSLRQIFTRTGSDAYRGLGGNPVQKIALTKLLLAIAQSAYTPKDEQDWRDLRAHGLANACMTYLEKWHDAFYLYGEKPFLQVPAIKAAKIQGFSVCMPEVASGNNKFLTQCQVAKDLSDADKAMLIVQSMGFCLRGKQTDNSVVLSPGYLGKEKTKGGRFPASEAGANLGFKGFLHSFLIGGNIQETVWFNLFQRDQIEDLACYSDGLGVAPWEDMPVGEACPAAERLKSSLIGRLVPLSRFMLLTDDGLHYSGGIVHPEYTDGMIDPSITVISSKKKTSALWVNPEIRPWRFLTSLLSFMGGGQSDCYQLRANLSRLAHSANMVGIWSGGLSVKPNMDGQIISGSDDYVDSVVFLNITDDSVSVGSIWYANLHHEMDELSLLSKIVYGRVIGYFKSQEMDGKNIAAQSSNLFWQLCEPLFQDLVAACHDESKMHALRPHFARIVYHVYDLFCPKDTARQIDAWAKNKPDTRKYLNFNHGASQ